jgi:hypothetical protein
MPFTIRAHDGWGSVTVGSFQTLEEARQAFATLRADPWYVKDGGMRALELLHQQAGGMPERLDWYAIR